MREKIPPTGRASRVLDSCSWALVDPSSHLALFYSVQALIFTTFPFHHEDSSSPLFLSTPLFTHLPPITSHQTVLGEFISVYNML